MQTLTTNKGRVLTYDPVGEGWTEGRLGDTDVHVYIRPAKFAGPRVFYRRTNDHAIVEAVTGEATVWFNNRLWTLTEEQELMERIKHDEV